MNEEGNYQEPEASGMPTMLAGPLGDELTAPEGLLSC